MENVRVRKVDIEKLSNEELEKIQAAISGKIVNIINKANEEANRVLNVYGMEVQLVMELKKKD